VNPLIAPNKARNVKNISTKLRFTFLKKLILNFEFKALKSSVTPYEMINMRNGTITVKYLVLKVLIGVTGSRLFKRKVIKNRNDRSKKPIIFIFP
jgi:uncharacterized membrane protein